jgi:bifunctional DNase/RNase
MLIDMRVASLTVDPFTNMPIVVLKCPDGRHSVAIWIGMIEASAIATELDRIELDRPMTHDLMATMLERCRVAVDRIEVHDLRDNTFYATVYLKQPDGGEVALDARPSDAIALALRARAPIRVAQKVVDKARRIDLRSEPPLPNLRASAVPADFPDFPDVPESTDLDLDLDGEIEPEAVRARARTRGSSLRVERVTDPESTYAALLESLGETAFGKWKM